jgi:hypothetical protein
MKESAVEHQNWLRYSRFIEVLLLLECYIPAFPQTINSEFLIFRWRTGYFPRGSGPTAPFIHREKEDGVTGLEIAKTLHILDIPEDIFWAHVEGCMVEPEKAHPAKPAPPTSD